ncbi:MAG: class I SAM-dependent methyltransferase [bacterium]|nr:class I SAM-dependent methyltransferase [bacterium]
MKPKIDWGLKFFHDVLRLEALHFGYWEGISIHSDSELNVENLKLAQKNYTNQLIETIPRDVKTLLDVGAGTGEVAKELITRGYTVEAVSPDTYQYEICKTKCPRMPFHRTKFEKLDIKKSFDVILMLESCQYLKLDPAFKNCKKLLKEGGYILISDYFRKVKKNYYRTTHTLEDFYNAVKKYNFEIVYEKDITEGVLPTLTLGKQFYLNYAVPVTKIITGYFSDKIPVLTKILKFVFSSPLRKIKYYVYIHTPEKLDVDKFRKNIEYKIILLKNSAS